MGKSCTWRAKSNALVYILWYLLTLENPTKTRQGGLRKNRRAIQPKMFATGGLLCPVQFFKRYLAHTPEEMRTSGPFYRAIIEKPKSEVWYKKQRMGVSKTPSRKIWPWKRNWM